ncbi:MAG: acyltransferase, partial [Flavobacteriales bacterium]|nr:acyltransferase [Flavobacteriales bacterium]
YNVFSTYYFPDASYFLLPSRAWEMLIGGVAFLFPWQAKETYKKTVQWLGLTMILSSYFLISSKTPWPGYLALFPVLGTYLIIISHRETSKVTNNFLFHYLGKWSYSIYLWHWPVVVYGYLYEVPHWIYVGIPLSILLGYLSFTFIESYKNKDGVNFFSQHCLVMGLIVLGLSCIQFYRTYSFITQHPDRIDGYLIGYHYTDGSGKIVLNSIEEDTIFNPQSPHKLLMLGDSNSTHYSYGISSSGTLQIHHKWEGSCFPFINANTKPYAAWMDEEWKSNCHNLYKFVDKHKNVPIIISNQWGEREMACTRINCDQKNFDAKTYDRILENELNSLIAYVGNRKIFLIGQVPAPLKSMVKCMKRRDTSECERETNEFTGNRLHINSLLEKIAKAHQNVIFINPFDVVCDQENRCQTVIDDKNLFFDSGHLSAFGSRVIWSEIEKQIIQKLDSTP